MIEYEAIEDEDEEYNIIKNESFTMRITSGKVAIGDACYFWDHSEEGQENWRKFLKEVEYFNRYIPQFHGFSTGGDGTFRVTLTFKEI